MTKVKYTEVDKTEVAFVGTAPVPARPYYDESYFELEREAIFRRVWLHLGRIAEIATPGQFIVRSIEVANASILVVHGLDGNLRAFYNVCAHRSTLLVAKESGKASSFSCRYHMWTYATDGSLRGVPDEGNFFDLDKSKCGLREVALETCAGFMFVNLDPSPRQSLREYLGVWGDRLNALQLAESSIFSEYVYEVNANWKTAYDNFQEIYHGRFVHAKSIGPSTMTPENPYGYPSSYSFAKDDLHRSKTLWFNPDYQPGPVEAFASKVLRETQSSEAAGSAATSSTEHFYIFPNLTLVSVRSRCFTQTIWPLGPNRSRGVIRQYWEGKDKNASMRFARELGVCTTLDIHSEDRDIIEAAQAGLRNRAFEHLHFQLHEVPLRHFFKAVDKHVEAYREELASQREAAP
jgi:phenylpropionate dioxygenase-like ring-hydroxylating dioxygenase large terminal subunit